MGLCTREPVSNSTVNRPFNAQDKHLKAEILSPPKSRIHSSRRQPLCPPPPIPNKPITQAAENWRFTSQMSQTLQIKVKTHARGTTVRRCCATLLFPRSYFFLKFLLSSPHNNLSAMSIKFLHVPTPILALKTTVASIRLRAFTRACKTLLKAFGLRLKKH